MHSDDPVRQMIVKMLDSALAVSEQFIDGNVDSCQTRFTDEVMSAFDTVSASHVETSASMLFKGFLSSLSGSDAEEAMKTLLKNIIDEIGFSPMDEPAKLLEVLGDLDFQTHSPGVSSSAFWTDFIRHSLAIIVSLVNQRREMERGARELTDALVLLCNLFGMLTKSNIDQDANLTAILASHKESSIAVLRIADLSEAIIGKIEHMKTANEVIRKSPFPRLRRQQMR